nr:hypothetical protein [Tanacetum cinerariifolium]
FWSTARIVTTEEGTKILATVDGEGSGTPTETHHTPSPEAQQTLPTTYSSPSLPHEPASPLADGSQGEACPTVTGLVAGHDMATITKTYTLPSDSTPRVTSLAADKGKLEITNLMARVKLLEDREGGVIAHSRDDAPIKGRSLDEGDEAAEKGSNDTEEMVNVF